MSIICSSIVSVFYGKTPERVAELYASGEVPPIPPMSDPFVLLAAAARGDSAAQRMLALFATASVLNLEEGDADPLTTISEGLMFARMAAIHGERIDATRLIGMLSLASALAEQRGDIAATDTFAGEAIARVELLAEGGDEDCSSFLAVGVESETAETMAIAQDYRARILASMETN